MTELHDLDASLVSLNGTASERIREARSSVDNVLCNWTPIPMQLEGDASQIMHQLSIYKDELEHTIKEMVDWCLAQQRHGTQGEREQLVQARDTLVKNIKALCSVAVQMGVWNIDDVPEIPNKPGSRGATSSSTPTHAFQYYTIIDGRRRNQSNHQNSLSSIAYYHGAKLLKLKDRPGVDVLKQQLGAMGCDYNVKGSNWQQELPGGIVGLEVVAIESDDNESEASETTNNEEGQ
jgi:hypothetical protein